MAAIRDRFILHKGLSIGYEKKMADLFDEKTVEMIFIRANSGSAVSQILGKEFLEIVKDSWNNAREWGKVNRNEMIKQNVTPVKGKKHYLTKDDLVTIYTELIFDMVKSTRIKVDGMVKTMTATGFSLDSAKNSVTVGRVKVQFMNDCRRTMIQLSTQLFSFGMIDGMWRLE